MTQLILMAQTTETPAETLQAATLEDALPQHGLVLLGTYIKPDDATAFVRTPVGQTLTVAPGDTLAGYTILAIETGAVHMARSGRTRKLTMPGDS